MLFTKHLFLVCISLILLYSSSCCCLRWSGSDPDLQEIQSAHLRRARSDPDAEEIPNVRVRDRITNLPGLPADVPSNLVQYSGYLQALGTRKLHYWQVSLEISADYVLITVYYINKVYRNLISWCHQCNYEPWWSSS